MKRPLLSRIVAVLSVLILAANSGYAGPITLFQVVQSINNYQNPAQLRLWDQTATLGSPNGQIVTSSSNKSRAKNPKATVPDQSKGSLLSGVVINPGASQTVSISEGEIEGTLCDCGEILVAAGGIPKWPFLFLAAVPLFFIHGGGENQPPPPGPTPTPIPLPSPSPPPPSIPEPDTLFLFLTGLTAAAALLRRRGLNSLSLKNRDR